MHERVEKSSTGPRRAAATRPLALVLLALLGASLPAAPAAAQAEPTCARQDRIEVPGAAQQDLACLEDLSTRGTLLSGHTERDDWDGLSAADTKNPSGFPGIQVDGYFPDDSTLSTNNADLGYAGHDSQFVIRLPDDWNGKLVITGAPGTRAQYANDFLISDFVLDRGYAFASTDKGNSGATFYEDGDQPGDAVAEWHRRVTQLTRASQAVARQRYGRAAKRTYMTGISNGGYLTRYALENHPGLYDGGVDWEGTLFRPDNNLLTYLPATLRNYPSYAATGDEQAAARIVAAGFAAGSKFLWRDHYSTYWDLTQRLYREEFDPGYDGALEGGVPFCQAGTGVPGCDADYRYGERPDSVRKAIGRVSNSGAIGRKLITLHGTLDTLLPIRLDSDRYAKLVRRNGEAPHRYYKIGKGSHVDGYYDDFPERLRPMLPCYRASFLAMNRWVTRGRKPPASRSVPKRGSSDGDTVNRCSFGGITYRGRGLPADPAP